MSTRDERIKRDPAFVLVNDSASGWLINGPDGLTWGVQGEREDAEYDCRMFNLAFYAGVAHAERKANAANVPGPQNPPRPIHSRECG